MRAALRAVIFPCIVSDTTTRRLMRQTVAMLPAEHRGHLRQMLGEESAFPLPPKPRVPPAPRPPDPHAGHRPPR